MTRNCQAPGRKRQTKKPLPHTWDKSRCFCDTTQIDVKNARSLTRTIIRAPMDNGWESRRSLLGECAVRSALRSPFAGRPPPRFHHRGLSVRSAAPGTSLRHWFVLFGCYGVLYAGGGGLSRGAGKISGNSRAIPGGEEKSLDKGRRGGYNMICSGRAGGGNFIAGRLAQLV